MSHLYSKSCNLSPLTDSKNQGPTWFDSYYIFDIISPNISIIVPFHQPHCLTNKYLLSKSIPVSKELILYWEKQRYINDCKEKLSSISHSKFWQMSVEDWEICQGWEQCWRTQVRNKHISGKTNTAYAKIWRNELPEHLENYK